MVKKIRKRDGKVVLFDNGKILEAIWKAARSVGGQDKEEAKRLSEKVIEKIEVRYREKDYKELNQESTEKKKKPKF